MILVIDEELGAELGREIDNVAAADRQVPIGSDRCAVWQQMRGYWPNAIAAGGYGHHICSGADTPRRSSDTARPIRADSVSHSRAC